MTTIHYPQFGGIYIETATMANALAAQGITAPHTGKPYSEALLLGIGGGLGAGYILWEFKARNAKIFVFGFQYRWNYTSEFYQGFSNRIGIAPQFHESSSAKTAQKQLEDVLDSESPGVVWVDPQHIPYYGLSDILEGCYLHLLNVYGIENGEALIDDLAKQPFRLPLETLAAARGRIGSYKNRLITFIQTNNSPDLPAAVSEGIRACIEHLSQPSESFSLPVFKKWAKMMTDKKNAKSWSNVFSDGAGLFGALCSVYEGVQLSSMGGGTLRGMYADFLDEAADILGQDGLKDAAAHYRALAGSWSVFAHALLDSAAPLQQARDLLDRRSAILAEKGGSGVDEVMALATQYNALTKQFDDHFPLKASEIEALYAELGERIMNIYDEEVNALDSLKAAIQ